MALLWSKSWIQLHFVFSDTFFLDLSALFTPTCACNRRLIMGGKERFSEPECSIISQSCLPDGMDELNEIGWHWCFVAWGVPLDQRGLCPTWNKAKGRATIQWLNSFAAVTYLQLLHISNQHFILELICYTVVIHHAHTNVRIKAQSLILMTRD